MDRNELFKSWSEKYGTPEEYEKEFQDKITKSKQEMPNINEADRENRVIVQMQGSLKKQFKSKAKKFVGVVINIDSARDPWKNRRQESIDSGHIMKEGPDKGEAVFMEDKGTRKEGSVIPQNERIRNIVGVAKLEEEGGALKPFEMSIWKNMEDIDKNIPEEGFPIKFRANCKDLDAPFLQLNYAAVTVFEVVKNEKVNPKGLMKYFPQHKLEELGEVEDRTIVATQGIVPEMGIRLDQTNTSHMIDLSGLQIDSGGLDENSGFVSCWIDKHKNTLEESRATEGSLMHVIGSVSHDAEGNPMLNIITMHADENYPRASEIRPQVITKENSVEKEEDEFT